MKTKQIPAILMLVAALVTCIMSFLDQISMVQFLIRLCIVLVVFFVLGEVIRYVIDRNFPPEEAQEEEQEETQDEEAEQVEPEDGNKKGNE